MTLLQFCKDTIELLEKADPKDFAALYVEKRMEVFRRYHNCLICSSAHGINYFHNVINFIDRPDEYKETEKGNSDYEEKF